MKKNMGKTDRTVRSIIAGVIAALYLTNVISGSLAIILLAIAIIFVATSFVSVCPLYRLIGVKTCSTQELAR